MKTKSAYNQPEKYILTSAAVNKVAAVEGIDLTGEIQSEFHDFDRRQLSDDEKLKAIKAKFAIAQD